jgi:tagaturonate reductase
LIYKISILLNELCGNLIAKNTVVSTNLPIKIIQFREGNFLRAFVEYAFQNINNEVGFHTGIAKYEKITKSFS